MYPRPNAKVGFFCNGFVVCSIDEKRTVAIPLKNFDFHPVVGQEISLGGRWDTHRLCPCDNLFDQHPLKGRKLDYSPPFVG